MDEGISISGVKNIPNIIFIATFSGVSPIGAAIGILISETVTDSGSLQTLAITILQGLATGSLIYVVFFEVIEKERQKKTNGLLIVSHDIFHLRKTKTNSAHLLSASCVCF